LNDLRPALKVLDGRKPNQNNFGIASKIASNEKGTESLFRKVKCVLCFYWQK